MSRIAYVNGSYVPHRFAAVHIEDRGYQLSDGVYEVCEVSQRYIVDLTGHLNRLDRSLSELEIRAPMSRAALTRIFREVAARNRIVNGYIYLQVTRGVAPRDHAFPASNTPPAVVLTARRIKPGKFDKLAEAGQGAITMPDIRWERVDIKSVGLLPNALARQRAREQNCHEAIFVDQDGFVTEGAATNVWIVGQDGELITRPAETGILRGITRTTLLDVAMSQSCEVIERAFTVDEMIKAREVFVTSATGQVMPIVQVDSQPIANGYPGSVARSLRGAFLGIAEKTKAW